jgi:hypothetical protein
MTKEIQTTNTAIGAFQGSRSLIFNGLTEIHKFTTMVCKTDLAPKGYRNKPEEATIAIIYGMEIGLPPMASLQNISVVNGTPAVWGDAQLSLVQSSGKYEYHKSNYKGTFPNDDFTAVFECKRIGSREPVIKEFSIADAKKANLWGKAGTWTSHAKVMLSYKARAFALREAFADILKGIHSKEEMEGESIIEINPQSKTAAAHNPPAELQKVYEEPELPFADVEKVVKQEQVMEQTNDFVDREKVEQNEEMATTDLLFVKHEAAIKSLGNEKGLNTYIATSDFNKDLEFLKENAEDLHAQIIYLKNEKIKSFKK